MGASINQNKRGGKRFGRGLNSEINVTPFVDVMLVLLVIFMVTSPMLVTGVVTDIPEASTKPLQGDDEPVTVEVGKDGTVYIQENPIPIEKLQEKLKAITKENTEMRIFVRGHTGANYGDVIAVLGKITESGFGKVALITQPPRGKGA